MIIQKDFLECTVIQNSVTCIPQKMLYLKKIIYLQARSKGRREGEASPALSRKSKSALILEKKTLIVPILMLNLLFKM